MRTAEDSVRSLKRYAALTLGGEWEVRLDAEQGMVTLPACIVRRTTPATWVGPRLDTLVTQGYGLYCTPAPSVTPEEAVVTALRVEELLFQGFRQGVDRGHPGRVPLYDYEGVSYSDSSQVRGYPDFMRIVDLSVNQLPDPDDPRRVDVVVDIRLSWRRGGAVPSGLVIGSVTSQPE